jgi:hypothetical protein
MFGSLDRVDWALLHQQKLVLLNVLASLDRNSSTGQALRGVVHLLDALQDDAVTAGRWRFPGEPVSAPATPPPSKRYYMEDDDGRHYGPMDEYEEAAGLADAIHGRIIVKEVEGPSASPEEDDDAEGGA